MASGFSPLAPLFENAALPLYSRLHPIPDNSLEDRP